MYRKNKNKYQQQQQPCHAYVLHAPFSIQTVCMLVLAQETVIIIFTIDYFIATLEIHVIKTN